MSTDLTLADVNALLASCGCCEHPRCCPPIVECRSVNGVFYRKGWRGEYDSDVGDSIDPEEAFFLRRTYHIARPPEEDVIGEYPEGTFVEQTFEDSGYHLIIQTYDLPYDASLYGQPFSGVCVSKLAEMTEECGFGGSSTRSFYGMAFVIDSWFRYMSSKTEEIYTSAEGEETPAHIAWETDHATWETAHAAWEIAHAEWEAGGGVGEEPEEPEEPVEPEATFDSCWCKVTTIVTVYDRVGTEVTVADGYPIETVEYTQNPLATLEFDVSYSIPVTRRDFEDEANTWMQAHADQILGDDTSDSSPACTPGDACAATREYERLTETNHRMREVVFKYRFKLNKCCGFRQIQSKWAEVFYPQEWLDWLEEKEGLGESDPVPPPPDRKPELTVRAWSWTGVPPLCDESDSRMDSQDDPETPYSYQPMWSPWSALVTCPANDRDGSDGRVENHYYYQRCMPNAPWDYMPEVFDDTEKNSESF